MDMEPQGLPEWVQPIATIFVTLSVLCALAVAYDIYIRGYRHRADSYPEYGEATEVEENEG